MATFNKVGQSIIHGSDSCSTNLRLEVGTNDKGKALIATVKLATPTLNNAEAVLALCKLGKNTVKVSLPAIGSGLATYKLMPIMQAERFAVVFAHATDEALPDTMSIETVNAHKLACGIPVDDVKTDDKPKQRKGKGKPETVTDPIPQAEVVA